MLKKFARDVYSVCYYTSLFSILNLNFVKYNEINRTLLNEYISKQLRSNFTAADILICSILCPSVPAISSLRSILLSSII